MYNWNIDLTELKKDKKAYAIWRLEQLINYGLAGERLSKRLLRRYWSRLHLDPDKKAYLKFLLWPTR